MAVLSKVIRCQTCLFSSWVILTQLATSRIVRPQPLHTSSKRVEQIPMQGESWPESGEVLIRKRIDQ
jgi:hypothetical protein